NTAHHMGARGPYRVEDPTLERLVLAPLATRVRPVECGHVSVDRNARLKNEPAHGNLLFSYLLLDRSRRGKSSPTSWPSVRTEASASSIEWILTSESESCASSFLREQRADEPAETFGIGDRIDLADAAAHDGERDHRD